MRRRTFMRTATAATLSLGGITAGSSAAAACDTGKRVPPIEFNSTASLLDANGNRLTDENLIAVWAEGTATNGDADGNGDAVDYGDTPIPLAASDGLVHGFGAILVNDGEVSYEYGNEEFVLNVWDSDLGGAGTVLWDEGHGQYWDLSKSSRFEQYAETNGYTVSATTDLENDLSAADGVVITTPSQSFTTSELDALRDHVANGGTVYLHDQSDYNDYDETANLNEIADALSVGFRFNDDEVTDGESNAGNDYEPITDDFGTAFDYFDDRDGIALEYGETYQVTVTGVTDGDTVDVEFDDGTTEEVRVLGLDAPETKKNSKYERVYEWEGIEDDKYLANWGENAADYATAELDGDRIDLFFDENEPVRDGFGRVLGYVRYDKSGDGTRNTLYNRDVVEQGYARVYDSSLSKHDDFLAAELDARAAGRRVWTESDPANSSEIRDRDADDMFVPNTSSVRTTNGAVADDRVPLYAESTATQQLDGGVDYSDIPLAAVDEANNTAMVGGLLINEKYEADEGYDVDTSNYENFVVLTNLIDYLGDGTGKVYIDGGHGQFGHEYSLSADDAAYYLRYLEGQNGIPFEGLNDITASALSDGRALIVTDPVDCYTSAELDELTTFIGNGGAVILMGSAKTEDVLDRPRANLNDVAAGIGSDLRLNEDQVVDDTNNVNSDPEVLETTVFDTSFPLFSAYT
ncbi:MAG: DUF4350 domain-containing protein [Halopenitus sp.]